MKKLGFVLLFGFICISQYIVAQTNFAAADINGQWQSTKPGAELILEIDNTQAPIVSLGKSTLTKSILGGRMYESITYDGNGVWKA